MMPLIPLSYLYTRNAEYINGTQTAIAGAVMVLLSLIGFRLFKRLFKSRFAALLGCLTGWVLFFAMRSVSDLKILNASRIGFDGFLIAYGAICAVCTLAVLFAARGRSGGRLYPLLAIFLAILLAFNAIPAVRIDIAQAQDNAPAGVAKKQFSISDSAPSPNVYWIHCDGMLGFDAFQRYYGDDQAEFARALTDRGFQINRSATLETNHTTKIAVPALMCPNFYDGSMREVLKDHETAITEAETVLSDQELQDERINSETRMAFERKGYLSQTLGRITIYYPPVSNRFYVTGDSGAYILESDDNFKEWILSIIQAGELMALITGLPNDAFFNTVFKLGEHGTFGFRVRRTALTHTLPAEQPEALSQGKNLLPKNRMMLEAINDSTYADRPTFDIIFYLGAHIPFEVGENGEPNTGDTHSVYAYAPQHRYAASMLICMIDQILARDPEAVIVLQADHGLHCNTKEEITSAFGEDAVAPIWNQVMSALRVPEKYQNGDETFALSNPLNMSRYLVNSFVGKNYAYVQ